MDLLKQAYKEAAQATASAYQVIEALPVCAPRANRSIMASTALPSPAQRPATGAAAGGACISLTDTRASVVAGRLGGCRSLVNLHGPRLRCERRAAAAAPPRPPPLRRPPAAQLQHQPSGHPAWCRRTCRPR